MSNLKYIVNGIVKENPTFVLLLGMCPTLATTTSAINGMSMGLATMFVLILSNMAIAAVARFIPDKVRIPSYIVIIATFVTLLQFLMQAYTPAIYETLGLFIPLIVVNCIVLGRAEAFANKHTVLESACDGIGMDSVSLLPSRFLDSSVRFSETVRHSVGNSFLAMVSLSLFLLQEPSWCLAISSCFSKNSLLKNRGERYYGVFNYHYISDICK